MAMFVYRRVHIYIYILYIYYIYIYYIYYRPIFLADLSALQGGCLTSPLGAVPTARRLNYVENIPTGWSSRVSYGSMNLKSH